MNSPINVYHRLCTCFQEINQLLLFYDIAIIRESQGKTRDKLSEEADISPHFLFEIETGKKV